MRFFSEHRINIAPVTRRGETKTRELLGGMEQTISSPNRSHDFLNLTNMHICKIFSRKNMSFAKPGGIQTSSHGNEEDDEDDDVPSVYEV